MQVEMSSPQATEEFKRIMDELRPLHLPALKLLPLERTLWIETECDISSLVTKQSVGHLCSNSTQPHIRLNFYCASPCTTTYTAQHYIDMQTVCNVCLLKVIILCNRSFTPLRITYEFTDTILDLKTMASFSSNSQTEIRNQYNDACFWDVVQIIRAMIFSRYIGTVV